MTEVVTVHDGPLLDEVRQLFQEYADSLAVDLSFQDFAGELAALPGDYAPPGGTLLLALIDRAAAGCVGVRRTDESRCEMKRLFVRPPFQRSGCGRRLAERAMAWAVGAGYERILLDTLPTMTGAQRMYERLGFTDVPAYRFNPIAGTRFMERRLTTHVRRAIPGDESILRALRLQALSDTPDAFGSTYEREFARTNADWQRWLSPGATFILTDEGGPKGVVAGARDAVDPGIVQLMAMWVHASLRGHGAADALVSSVLAWAVADGARAMRLAVIESNIPARRCYERHGFRDTGHRTVRERDGVVEMQMERRLNPDAG